jgi:tripartite-type tricarboxylate transporter receptor subunit TctC
MTRRRRVATALLALTTIAAQAKEIAPYRAELIVQWGRGAGSDVFRDELARTVAQRLATGCFKDVRIAERQEAESDAELTYTIVLSDVIDETRFDDTIAAALQPGEPTKELRRVAYFEITADAILTARANGAVISRKHMVAHAERRPIYVGEDPQAFARAEAVGDVVDTLTRALSCGSAKLTRKVRDAVPD